MKEAFSLNKLERALDKKLQKQTQEGLSKLYEMLGCSGVAKEIKAGRKVTENAEFGIRICVHDKVAPTVNPETLKFYPQTKRSMELEEKFIDRINKVLENGGFRRMSPSLLSELRKGDRKFENRIKKLRGKRK